MNETQAAALILDENGHVLLRPRGVDERWASLWDFPSGPVDNELDRSARQQLVSLLQERFSISAVYHSVVASCVLAIDVDLTVWLHRMVAHDVALPSGWEWTDLNDAVRTRLLAPTCYLLYRSARDAVVHHLSQRSASLALW